MTVIKDVKVNIKLNNPNIKSSINTPNISLNASVNTPSTCYERNYNNLLNLPKINSVTLKGDLTPQDLNMTTSQLTNDGDGSSPFVNETHLNELRQELDDLITEVVDEGINVIREDIEDIREEIAGVDTDLNSHIVNSQNRFSVIENDIDNLEFDFTEHIGDYDNPHNVTKEQIGLGNVNNTSDLDKPISTLTQNALTTLTNNLNNEISRSTSIDNQISTTLQNEMNTRVEEHAEIQSDINDINAKIPIQASSSNQLADKDFVNSTINSSVATFRGNFATKAALDAWQLANPNVAKNNDYCYVERDETRNNESWRYIYVIENGVGSWQAQFKVNDTPFTAEQLAAINSGATAQIINSISSKLTASDILDSTGDSSQKAISQRAATLAAQAVQSNLNSHINDNNNPHQVSKSQIGLSNVDNTSDANKPISNATQNALNEKLSLSGGTLTGLLYTEASTPYFIGKNKKVGMRAVDENNTVVGQFFVSDTSKEQYNGYYSGFVAQGNDGKNYALRISANGPVYRYNSTDHLIALKEEIPTNNNQLTNGAGYITSSGSISGTAANANKLNNQDANYYLNYNNFTNKPTIDSALSTSSTNAVQNKIVTEALDAKLNTDGGTIENGLRVKKLSDTPLVLQTKDSNACYMEFVDQNGTTLGYYGVNSSKQPVFYLNGDRLLAFKDEIPSGLTIDSSLSTSSTNAVQNKVITQELNNKLNLSGGQTTGKIQWNNSDTGIQTTAGFNVLEVELSTTNINLGDANLFLRQRSSDRPTCYFTGTTHSFAFTDDLTPINNTLAKKVSGPGTTVTNLGSNVGAYTPSSSGFIVAESSQSKNESVARIKNANGVELCSNLLPSKSSLSYNQAQTIICPVCAGVTYQLTSSSDYTFKFISNGG